MKMVYTNESSFLVNSMKDRILAEKIEVFIKNEYAQGAMGELSPFDTWPEVWVANEQDFDRATEIVNLSQSNQEAADWTCKNCSEENDGSFEVCWKCQQENT